MSFRIAFPVLCLGLSIAAAQTVDPGRAAAVEVREIPPDIKAYNAANALTDPEKKIDALLKFKSDFPESPLLRNADQAVLTTLVRRLPGETARIHDFAARMYAKASEKDRGSVAQTIAAQFLGAKVLLNDARSYAERSVAAMNLNSYLRDQLAGYQQRNQTPPSSSELERRFRESRAARISTLGRIELQLGHDESAKKLLMEAHAALPNDAAIQIALGELAAREGDDARALEYLIPARLSGFREATGVLEAVYRKQHGDSTAGLEAMLDAEYVKRFPNPVKPEPYQPTANRSDRMVLAEFFTGSGCGPCAAADLAFDAIMERYSRKDLAVVMYHEHIPRPDPMTNPSTQARKGSYGVAGVPTIAIDGKKTAGGGTREMTRQTYDRIIPSIERALETPAEAKLRAEASLTGNVVRVAATVDSVQSESADLKVQIALVEKKLRFSGENGIRFHPMVVRAMGGREAGGFPLDAPSKTFEQAFDLEEISKAIKAHLDAYEAGGHRGEAFTFAEKKYQIDRGDLAVVVFVQDDKTKHVLQTAYIDLGTAGGPSTEASTGQK